MITLRKLASLKESTRLRKYPLLLQHFEEELKINDLCHSIYFSGLLQMIQNESSFHGEIVSKAEKLIQSLVKKDHQKNILWNCNSLRHGILQFLGGEPGDWDFAERGGSGLPERVCGDFFLYLDGIRSPFNVGAIFRSAESFGVKKVFLSEETCSPEHQRARRSSMGCIDLLPWSFSSIDDCPEPYFALELGGNPLKDFLFPSKGTLIIGSEELGVSPKALKKADEHLGRVSIETGGAKGSINVSVATGIALQKWFESIF